MKKKEKQKIERSWDKIYEKMFCYKLKLAFPFLVIFGRGVWEIGLFFWIFH